MRPLRLPPYHPRPDESLLAKCERIKREIQAAARGGAANENERDDPDEGGCFWWERD